ncbi:GntR family transcriptional regulator [Variovorax sp. J22G21]|uniref:GntR family transcriptional regulator n=1 Tax=Variovorax fucosicus TaxID=3053517 RepID=UPI0025788CBD|nr:MULTISPECIES: GntR family transcriptional regulator [unclassified Variovorax]MDM0040473.1 GntR family transcriptional regulator [Variovorax sp. J22R193]MDM0061846.1 GntR family transcriptional regulator [Variovorax sp. J22G21]
MNTTLEPAPQKANFSNIARHLTDAITSGHFAVGALLPTELELCRHYGTSRHTVRAALAELQQLGLVSRRKNVGTRVVSMKPRPSFRPSLASVDDLVQFGAEHLRAVQSIEQETVTGELAKELGCGDGTPWLRISSLRMVGDEGAMPIGWTDVYVDPRYAEIGDLVRASPDTLISSLIEERYDRHIAEIHQDVRAFTITDGVMAGRLQVEVGASALKIVRRYLDAEGEVFEMSVSVHPADRFSVSMRLRR